MTAAVKDLATIERDMLVDSRGRPYKDFRASLSPKYGVVWRDIAIGYLSLALIAFAITSLASFAPILAVLIGAPFYGYAIAAIHLFIHEGGHYNLAPNRQTNDLLANFCVGVLIGLDVRDYRVAHFEHHRRLGEVDDPERSYFSALTLRFIVESLTGIRVLKVLLGKTPTPRTVGAGTSPRADKHRAMTLIAILAQGIALLLLWRSGFWPVAVAWVLGLAVFFPFFASVRQVLEHRDLDAEARVDYASVPHGTVNRLFGDGPLASTLGSAGFNRHLLHHLEPQISYTRLRELEDYLRDTRYADILQARTTTYTRTFRQLYSA